MLRIQTPPDHLRRGAVGKSCLGILVAVLLVALAIGAFVMGKYNGIVDSRETVDSTWSKVMSDYKHRSENIPQLVATVKGASDYESETLKDVIEARNQATRIEITPELLADEAAMARFFEAQEGLTGALSRLFALREDYPALKAVDSFQDLQSQVEGMNNRINTSRKDYIDAVRNYNSGVKKFPGNVIAGTFGFESLVQFQAEDSDMEVPEIDFGSKDE